MDKRKHWKRMFFLLAAVLAVSGGCGKKTETVPETGSGEVISADLHVQEKSGIPAETPGTPAPLPEEEEEVSVYAEGNGGAFVQVTDVTGETVGVMGTLTWFRQTGEETLSNGALNGRFSSEPNDRGTAGTGSLLVGTDAAGSVKKTLADDGYGSLFWGDGWFYSTASADGDDMVYRIRLSDGLTETLGRGRLAAVSDDGHKAIVEETLASGTEVISIYEDGKMSWTAAVKGISLSYLGIVKDQLYLTGMDWDAGSYAVFSASLSAPGVLTKLGTVPLKSADSSTFQVPEQVIAGDRAIYILCSSYEGSMMTYAGGLILRAEVGTENSIVKEQELTPEVYNRAPYIEIRDGMLAVLPREPGTAEVAAGDLVVYDEHGQAQKVKKSYAGSSGEGSLALTGTEYAEVLGDRIFLVRHTMLMSPAEDIGWRSYYRRLSTAWTMVNMETGEETVLAETGGSCTFRAQVWAEEGRDAKTILVRPEVKKGGTTLQAVNCYRLIVSDSFRFGTGDWNQFMNHMSGSEAVLAGELTIQPDGGYSLPETKSGGSFLITVDGDGTVAEIGAAGD